MARTEFERLGDRIVSYLVHVQGERTGTGAGTHGTGDRAVSFGEICDETAPGGLRGVAHDASVAQALVALRKASRVRLAPPSLACWTGGYRANVGKAAAELEELLS